ncbi:MAG: DUF4366 domain-containing protein [Oscillospiraceae bacterium]|nr:DUF4366 domain-containing protein [Oscillospiraceae bacterium]
MKKLISILVTFCLCGAFFIPVYAEEAQRVDIEGMFDTTEITEIIIPETSITLTGETPPPPVVIIPPLPSNRPEPREEADPPVNNNRNNAGVVNTPQGTGVLLEDVCNTEVSRQFITVQSRGGNVFYIIIDTDRNGQNVYFLNAVDDFDLLTFSEDFPDGVVEAYEEAKEEALKAINGEDSENTETKPTRPSASNPEAEEETAGGMQNIIIAIIGGAFLIGLVYFKVIKPKRSGGKQKNTHNDEEEHDEEDI